MSYFEPLRDELQRYLDPLQVEKCYQAYIVAERGHQGQMRRSGEPYITHPVEAALFCRRCVWTTRPSWPPCFTMSLKTQRSHIVI